MFAGQADACVQEANLTFYLRMDTVWFMQKGGLNSLYLAGFQARDTARHIHF